MSKHQYSPANFFWQTSSVLLDRYFHQRNLLTDTDIPALCEKETDSLYLAWSNLPQADQAKTENDFTKIDLVANEQGIETVIDEGRFHQVDLSSKLAEISGFYDRAFWTFLEHPSYFDVAARFCEADEKPLSYWLERVDIPASNPRDDQAGVDDLSKALKEYFRLKEGRGKNCKVDVFRRGSRYYYFTYLEDYSQTSVEYEGYKDELKRRMYRPTFEVVFVYDPEKKSLSVCYKGRKTTKCDLQEIFAREILVEPLPVLERDQKVFELNLLKDRHFSFNPPPDSGIDEIRVKLLKLSLIGGGRYITLEANPSEAKQAVYNLMDTILQTADSHESSDRMPISLVNIVKAGFVVKYQPEKDGKPRNKQFTVSYPNTCNLKHEGKDAVLRQMLIDSGIGPRISEEDTVF